jgi:hypothetical protein
MTRATFKRISKVHEQLRYSAAWRELALVREETKRMAVRCHCMQREVVTRTLEERLVASGTECLRREDEHRLQLRSVAAAAAATAGRRLAGGGGGNFFAVSGAGAGAAAAAPAASGKAGVTLEAKLLQRSAPACASGAWATWRCSWLPWAWMWQRCAWAFDDDMEEEAGKEGWAGGARGAGSSATPSRSHLHLQLHHHHLHPSLWH